MAKLSKILALETTDAQGSVALCENERAVAFRLLPSETRSARSLAPTIRQILADAGWRPNDVDAVAVAVGPGSFTGLRVGVATAKMFAWAVGAPIVGVDSLEAIASTAKTIPEDSDTDASPSLINLTTADAAKNDCLDAEERLNWSENGAILSVGLDAQRGDAAVRRFWVARDGARAPIPLDERFRVISLKKWLNVENQLEFDDRFDWVKNAEKKSFFDFGLFLNKIGSGEQKDVYFCGSALNRRKNFDSEIYSSVAGRFVDEKYWNPTALGVANVAWRRINNDEVDDVWRILPSYSRKAAAEERLLEK